MNLTPCQDSAAESFSGFLFDDRQREFLLTGPAGSGKTFLLRQLIKEAHRQFKFDQAIEDSREKEVIIDLTATTNKAADVVADNFPNMHATTLHSFLGVSPKWDMTKKDYVLKFSQKNKSFRYIASKDEKHVLVVDEASMLNKELYGFLEKWLERSNSKILYVADSYQLPPVGEKISYIFQKGIPSANLSEVVRQSSDSNLAKAVRVFRQGVQEPEKILPDMPAESDDVRYYSSKDSDAWFDAIRSNFPDSNTLSSRILCFTNNRAIEYINWLRREWNLGETPDVGDIAINNYAVMYRDGKVACPGDTLIRITAKETDEEYGVHGHRYTGQPIVPRSWMEDYFSFFVPNDFSEKKDTKRMHAQNKAWSDWLQVDQTWGDIRFPQAMTVHKSQGSTFEEVFVDVTNFERCRDIKDYRRLLYVAASRPSTRLHLLGTPK